MKECRAHVGLVCAQGRGRGARRGRLPWRNWTALHMRRHRQKAAPHIAGMPSQGPRQRVLRAFARVRTVRSRESGGGARIAEHAHSRHDAPSQCTFCIAARGRMHVAKHTRTQRMRTASTHSGIIGLSQFGAHGTWSLLCARTRRSRSDVAASPLMHHK